MAKKPPPPLTPPDCDVGALEPPWDLFVQMGVDTFGEGARASCQAAVDAQRREWWAAKGTGAL